jgi:hypothetical protein
MITWAFSFLQILGGVNVTNVSTTWPFDSSQIPWILRTCKDPNSIISDKAMNSIFLFIEFQISKYILFVNFST